MLILAGITVVQLTESGLFGKAKLAEKRTRYANAKETVNLKLMEIQVDCTEKGEEYNIIKIAEGMKKAEDITIEKYYNKETGSIKEGVTENLTKLEGIVVSVDEYLEYKFLIGESREIIGVLEGEITNTTSMGDFIDLETFETSIFGSNVSEADKIKFSYELSSYENNKFKILIKVTDGNGIETIQFPDGDILNCNGKKEIGIDYEVDEGVDYIFIAKNSKGNEIREIINFTKPAKPIIPDVSGGYLTFTLNGVKDSDIEMEINYDEREDFLNYYSIDNGQTWKLYTGSIKANFNNIKAKSVHKKCQDIFEENEKVIVTPVDAVTWKAVDDNIDTYDLFSWHLNYETFKNGHYCLFNVDSSMWGEYLSITYYIQNSSYIVGIKFYDEENNEISSDLGPMRGGEVPKTDDFEVPEGTYRVKLYNHSDRMPLVVNELKTYGIGNEEVDYETYVDTHMEVDKKIYISSKYGSDITGDGTQNNPYSTLDKISEQGIIENGYSYAIVLMNGKYELTPKIFELNCNEKINIIGNKKRTILEANDLYANSGGGSNEYEVNIYRVVWMVGTIKSNAIFLNTKLSLYNVAFYPGVIGNISYFIPNNEYAIYNCTMPHIFDQCIRCTHGTIKLTNCYGGFTSGYSTVNNSWDYQTNYITETPQVDTKTYRIIDEESKWKNIGTGTNPDGTQANLGVYGGKYSWEE